MENYEQLLDTWRRSASVMHISHHLAAARCARIHRVLGVIVAGLGAVVASSIFISVSKSNESQWLIITGVVSLITAILSAANSYLDFGGKSQRHFFSAVAFQALRRELEEEIVRLKNGKQQESYEYIRNRWTATLENSIPLPQDIHDDVKGDIDSKYDEQKLANRQM